MAANNWPSTESRSVVEDASNALFPVLAISSLAGGLIPLLLIITWPGPQEPEPGIFLWSLVYGGPFVGLATGILGAVVSKSKYWALITATLLGIGLSVLELAFFATMHGWTL